MNKSRSTPFRIFLLIFGCILLGLQIYNYIYVRNIDNKYSDIISKKMESLLSFQIIAHESSDIQRALRSLTIANIKDTAHWKNEIIQSDKKINSSFDLLRKSADGDSEKFFINNLYQSYLRYKFKVDSFSSIIDSRRDKDTSFDNGFSKVRAIYEDYMNKEDENTSYFRDQALKLSEVVSKSTIKTTNFLLFVGTLPYLILVCGLIISLVIIVWLGSSLSWLKRGE